MVISVPLETPPMKTHFDLALAVLVVLFFILVGGSIVFGVAKEWVFALLTALLSVLGWIYAQYKSSAREAEARLFPQKAEVYKKVFETIGNLLKQAKDTSASPRKSEARAQQDLQSHLFDIKTGMLIWASDKTLKAWLEIENTDPTTLSHREILELWGKLYGSMRADLGHVDGLISERDLAGFYLTKEARQELG
jgi:flagellar basal body-associated protein FliL